MSWSETSLFQDDMKIMSLEGDELMTFLPNNCFLKPHSLWVLIKGPARLMSWELLSISGSDCFPTGFAVILLLLLPCRGPGCYLIIYVGGFTNESKTNQMKVTKSCSLFPTNYIIKALNLTVATSIDIFLVGVMLTTSAYMVLILFRHQRQHKYLHSLNHPRSSPEKRATQTILLLVTFFVVMYWVDFIISSTAVLLWMYNPVIQSIQKLVINVYPTVTPLVQISSDNRIINILKNIWSKYQQIL
ncbi:hypothetical protein ACRRTK_005419 [Alexandromys fortis]